jgi:hypothetical protein
VHVLRIGHANTYTSYVHVDDAGQSSLLHVFVLSLVTHNQEEATGEPNQCCSASNQ